LVITSSPSSPTTGCPSSFQDAAAHKRSHTVVAVDGNGK
jgi:hypothetical protein